MVLVWKKTPWTWELMRPPIVFFFLFLRENSLMMRLDGCWRFIGREMVP